MTQVINHDLGYKIVHNPGYDFDLGYKNKSDYTSKKINTRLMKNSDLFL